MPQRSTWNLDQLDPSLPLQNKIDRWIKLRLINLAERLFSRKILSPKILGKTAPRRILIIRPHDQLGDFLLSTPAVGALRNRFPDSSIGILVKEYFADAVRMNPAIDEILVFYPKLSQWTLARIAGFWKALVRRWDMAVVLSSESHSLTSDLLAVLSGAEIILGSDGFVFPGCTRNFLYNLVAPDRGLDRHQSERNLDIVGYIGGETTDRREKVFIGEDEKTTLNAELEKMIRRPGRPVVGLHIGANKIPNRWPPEKFAELANRLDQKLKVNVIVFWGPRESELAERFMRRVNFKPVRIPPSSLRNLAVYFSLCDAAVCNDTGIMHLCAGVGTPLVALFGPTNPKTWKPVGEQFIAVRNADCRTENIRVEDVFQQTRKLLVKSWKN